MSEPFVFDSRCTYCKEPFGAVECGTPVSFRCRPLSGEGFVRCTLVLQEHFHCEGINIGLNQGQAAGAGIREHLHFHLVPRWNGDSSFMAVMDEVRTIPEHLRSSYAHLKPYFDRF